MVCKYDIRELGLRANPMPVPQVLQTLSRVTGVASNTCKEPVPPIACVCCSLRFSFCLRMEWDGMQRKTVSIKVFATFVKQEMVCVCMFF